MQAEPKLIWFQLCLVKVLVAPNVALKDALAPAEAGWSSQFCVTPCAKTDLLISDGYLLFNSEEVVVKVYGFLFLKVLLQHSS